MMKNIIIHIISIFSCVVYSQESLNMDLVSNLAYPQGTNDIWGYSDGVNEYALVGTQTGFSVVDISCPQYPVELFFINGSNSVWRDIKTWDNYAYVTTEASDGLLIVDLNDLSGETYVYTEEFFTTSHNIYIDENGYAYIFGANTGNGGAIILDLNEDPMNPTLAGTFEDYYLHDGMVRGDTLWGSAIYAGVFSIIDVSDKSNPEILSSYPTSCQFTHNAWISDDNNYLFTTDESSGCYIGSYDVTDIYDIQEIDLIQEWTGDGADGNQEDVIPHNTHVLGDYLVTSYYTSGITIIDASDPFNLIEFGYYDTSPMTGGNFDGCWGAYPYLPSGLILATDQQEGLFILHALDITHDAYDDIINSICQGCMDSISPNFNPWAVEDDGSCIYIFGCTDSEAENYSVNANSDDGSCEYYCDDFEVMNPVCDNLIQVNYGETVILNCEGELITFLDSDYNTLSTGSNSYVTTPIYENTSFFVFVEEVVESFTTNVGEPEHESVTQGGDYSSEIYNGGLLFNCYSTFTLNSVKVYTDYPGERMIELKDNNGSVINELLIDIPETDENGYVIPLNWTVNPGNQYLLTTNTEINNVNFGDNNPMLKRTTGGLPSFPFIINNILEISDGYYTQGDGNDGTSQEYYYYYYDWEVEYSRSCESELSEINVIIHNSNLLENDNKKLIVKTSDLLGRKNHNKGCVIQFYDDGSSEKNFILK